LHFSNFPQQQLESFANFELYLMKANYGEASKLAAAVIDVVVVVM